MRRFDPKILSLSLLLPLAWISPAAAGNWNDALRWKTESGDWSLKIGGRVHGDYASIVADDSDAQGEFTEWRRARLNVSAKMARDWRLRYEYDFAAEDDYKVKDAYLGYYGFDDTKIRIGNVQEPVSLEELTHSDGLTFMERALPNALVPGYKLGLLINTWGKEWSLAGGIFEGNIHDRDEDGHEGWGTAGRMVYSPKLGRKSRLHLGVSAEYRVPPEDNRVSYSSKPEMHLSDRRMVSTGTLSRVDYTLTQGVELAGLWGPWSLQGEYLQTNVERTGREDVVFNGWYVQASWFISGGKRNYNRRDAAFKPVKPDNKRFGAWELAARYSELTLEDDPITGGEERNWTVGLNWYISKYARVMVNRVQAEADPNRSGDPEEMKAVQARFQFSF